MNDPYTVHDVAHDMSGRVGTFSIRPCDECGTLTPFDRPDAPIRVCRICARRVAQEESGP
ncbi:MAG: hypothetical protein WBF81_05975 [Thermoplasmata archaeon]